MLKTVVLLNVMCGHHDTFNELKM